MGVSVIEQGYTWAAPLQKRSRTQYLVLHHEAASGFTAQEIHRFHLGKGWSGIGYHYYVRKTGTIYRGRPEDACGAHTQGYNSVSIGICFEGNFETDTMYAQQYMAGKALVKEILTRYPDVQIVGHKELNATACPGKNFPLGEFKHITAGKEDEDDMTGEDIYRKLNEYLRSLDAPDWARAELEEARAMGITDGLRPMELIPRYQAAIMAKRAAERAREA